MQRFRGGLVFKAHRLCVALNSRLESNKEEEDLAVGRPELVDGGLGGRPAIGFRVRGLPVHRLCATTDHSENS